jgi:hypothetical protein
MDLDGLYQRIHAMDKDDLRKLDPICAAIGDYLAERKEPHDGAMIIPNRVLALACVDLHAEWQRQMLERYE